MSNSKLIELSYYDPSAQVRLSAYADTLVLDHDQNGSIISAIRFGGYPEMVRAMADAIYGGATIEAAQNDTTRMLQSSLKSYQRQITHDGIYAVATLMAADTVQEDDRSGKHEKDEDTATARRHICIVPKTSVFSISSLRSPKIRMHSIRSAERTGGFP